MENTSLIPKGLISPALLNQYVAAWVQAVDNPDPTALRASFTLPSPTPPAVMAQYVSLPLRSIVELVSTVGGAFIKTQFLVQDTGQFTLALYGADDHGIRLTSYYLADDQATVAVPNASTTMLGTDGEVPTGLAGYWRTLWAQYAPALTSQQFGSSYGHLRGYTFDRDDFLDTLALLSKINTSAFDDYRLVVYFALHEYYRPGPEGDTLGQTFGLVLQLVDITPTAMGNPPLDPYYDMSAPCPPNC